MSLTAGFGHTFHDVFDYTSHLPGVVRRGSTAEAAAKRASVHALPCVESQADTASPVDIAANMARYRRHLDAYDAGRHITVSISR